MKETISYTFPVIVPDLPKYEHISKNAKDGVENMNKMLEEGWRIKAVSSATSFEVIYNTYILEK